MINLPQLSAILAPNFRSRAILQMLHHAGFKMGSAIILPGDEPEWTDVEKIHVPSYSGGRGFDFYPAQSIRESLTLVAESFVSAPTADINSDQFVDFIKQQKEEIYLYSGPAGCILRPTLLRSGKRFIHAHGGDAPRYSGSTAFYYSILERGDIGATCFWMDEGLDTGKVINRLVAPPHQGIEIDRIQDPVIRAEALMEAIRNINRADLEVQSHHNRVTYHVIHPVLKHYALAKAGLGVR